MRWQTQTPEDFVQKSRGKQRGPKQSHKNIGHFEDYLVLSKQTSSDGMATLHEPTTSQKNLAGYSTSRQKMRERKKRFEDIRDWTGLFIAEPQRTGTYNIAL